MKIATSGAMNLRVCLLHFVCYQILAEAKRIMESRIVRKVSFYLVKIFSGSILSFNSVLL